MIYRGQIRVTMSCDGCGFADETIVGYCVEVSDISEVKRKVEESRDNMAEAWHDQTGCGCHGNFTTTFHWDE